MGRRFLFILILALSCTMTLLAQSDQRIIVYEYNGTKTKKPMPNVEVVVNNAGTSVTGKDGSCVLHFRTLKPGDKITIKRIENLGYSVFNKEALDQWYISRTNEPLTILLVSDKYHAKLRDNYQKSAANALLNARSSEEKDAAKLAKEGLLTKEQYDKKIADIKAKYEEKLEDVGNYIEHFTHIDLSNISKDEEQILRLVKEGKLDEAIALYDTDNLLSTYKKESESLNKLNDASQKVKEKLAQSAETREKVLQSLKNQYELLIFKGGDENVNKAYSMLKSVALADTTNYPVLLFAGHAFFKSTSYNDAEKVLLYVTRSPNTIERLEAWMHLAAISQVRENIALARDGFEELYSFLEGQSLNRQDSTLYLEDKCFIVYHLLNCYSDMHDKENALKYIPILLNTAETMVAQNSSIANRRNLADQYYYVSSAYGAMKNNELRYKYLMKAIDVEKQLYAEQPIRQTAMMAFLYSKLASYDYVCAGDSLSGNEAFDQSVHLYEFAYQYNRVAYSIAYANNLTNFATMLIQTTDNYGKSLELLNRGRKVLLETSASDSLAVRLRLGINYASTAYCLENLGQSAEEALDDAKLAVKILQPYYESEPNAYRQYLGIAYLAMSGYYALPQVKQIDKEKEWFLKAEEIDPTLTIIHQFQAQHKELMDVNHI